MLTTYLIQIEHGNKTEDIMAVYDIMAAAIAKLDNKPHVSTKVKVT